MSIFLNAHRHHINVGFNRVRNIDKAAYVLKGIIDGVEAEGYLADAEILYLDAWMRCQKHLDLQAVAFDLFQAVNNVLEDQRITHAERADLHRLIHSILDFGADEKNYDDDARINEFLSLLKGICANGVINCSEIRKVEAWMSANKDLSKAFPIKPVYNRIRDAVKNNVIDGEELANLNELVSEITGEHFTQTGDVDGCIGQVFCDDVKHLSFEGKTFCFTGKFLSGTRKQCQAEARNRGASVKSSVTADVDVLVIGSVTSRDWRYQNFGRKIVTAMDLRAEQGKPTILSEAQWTAFLRYSKPAGSSTTSPVSIQQASGYAGADSKHLVIHST